MKWIHRPALVWDQRWPPVSFHFTSVRQVTPTCAGQWGRLGGHDIARVRKGELRERAEEDGVKGGVVRRRQTSRRSWRSARHRERRASCRAFPLPRWCEGTSATCAAPERVCPVRRCWGWSSAWLAAGPCCQNRGTQYIQITCTGAGSGGRKENNDMQEDFIGSQRSFWTLWEIMGPAAGKFTKLVWKLFRYYK